MACCKKNKGENVADDENEFASDENTIRGNWSNKLDFIVALISYSVGFGNVWRFPYLCYRNGGGAFLFPYFIMLVLAGIPIYYLELIIAQYSSLGPIEVWKLCPLFKGLGLGAVLVTGVVNIYYNTLIAYALFYFFASMTSELPWATCGHPWNTPACRVDAKSRSSVMKICSIYHKGKELKPLLKTLTDPTNLSNGASRPKKTHKWNRPIMMALIHIRVGNDLYNTTAGNLSVATNGNYMIIDGNMSNMSTPVVPRSPAEEYFENYVLDISSGIDELGGIRWQLVLCLLLGWIICFFILIKGIKSAGKVAYFTATFPYFILFALLVRGLTLEGSWDGLSFYLIPEWDKLATSKVWADAAAQIFYSLGPCWGGLIAFGSYNEFHNNILRDTLVCSLVCCGTSLLAGTVIFSIIGFMANDLNVTISDVMTSGPGLAFVAYPEALARMPIGPLWSVIFFAMLLCCGISSLFTQTEMLVVAITDMFPILRKRKMWFTLFVIFIYFLIGLPQVTRGGMYILNLVDWYVALFSIIVVGLLEVVVLSWVYGYKSVCENARVMLGKKPSIFFIATWCVMAPGIIVAICVFNAIQHSPATYNDYRYPDAAIAAGWLIAIMPILPVPGYMVYLFAKHVKSWQGLKQTMSFPWTGATIRELCRPAPDWGPMMPQYRKEAGLPPLSEATEPLKNVIFMSDNKKPMV